VILKPEYLFDPPPGIYVFVCDGCGAKQESDRVPEGWQEQVIEYGSWPTICSAFPHMKHWCPNCSTIKDIIE